MSNAVIDALISRRSIRQFKPELPPEEMITEIIRCGTYAATGRNYQSPRIIRISDPAEQAAMRKLNAEIMGNRDIDPFYGAPVILLVVADRRRPTYLYDGSLVIGNLMLAAHSLGLGRCWIHRAKEEMETSWGKALLRKVGLSDDYEGIGHCAIGFADMPLPEPPPRREDYVLTD